MRHEQALRIVAYVRLDGEELSRLGRGEFFVKARR